MARVLESYQFPTHRPPVVGMFKKHPDLQQWLNGQVWQVDQGDYKIKPVSFMQTLYKAANVSHKTVRIHREGDVLIFQAKKRPGRKAGSKTQEQGGSHVGTQPQT